ncbi:MAG: hypothetical protein IPL99_14720, partial [Candidatus Competibacteraceae bacterium]|nr:hypothetical protein [Candidatus Competibacteraceae bacterium]
IGSWRRSVRPPPDHVVELALVWGINPPLAGSGPANWIWWNWIAICRSRCGRITAGAGTLRIHQADALTTDFATLRGAGPRCG